MPWLCSILSCSQAWQQLLQEQRQGTLPQQVPGTQPTPAELGSVLAQLCFQQLQVMLAVDVQASAEEGLVYGLEGALGQWVTVLTPEAAAAALFAVWQQWKGGRVQEQLSAGAAVPLLYLELYQRGKSTGDSLVFDLGLAAAEHTGNWHRGRGIIAAAKKAAQHAADSRSTASRRSQAHSDWLPTLPAACCALLSVLVHTEGVEAAGKLLTAQEQGMQAQQQPTAASGRKGKAARSSASSREQAAAAPSALLSLPAVNAFLSAAVAVAAAYQVEGLDDDAESAAQSAVQVAQQMFKQVVAVSLGDAGAGLMAAAAGNSISLVPDTTTWGYLAQLYGVLGQWQQVSNIVLAAAKQQLPGVGGDSLQVVLAGAAAAFKAAGRHVSAVQLLDGLLAAGVGAVTHPELAQQLEKAADKSADAEQELGNRLAAGEEAIYEALPELAAAVGRSQGASVPAVQLVGMEVAVALKQLTSSLSTSF